MNPQLHELNQYFHKILVLDIETVSISNDFDNLSEVLKKQWERKAKFLSGRDNNELSLEESFNAKAGIYAEFGKVVCIGMGIFDRHENNWDLRLKSLHHNDEKELLKAFAEIVNKMNKSNKEVIFCGHNIKEFDLPFLCRRMLVNGIKLPKSMQLSGMKPWQINHLDTLELWRFGDYKHYTSLELIAEVLGIASPKDDIDGSMVSSVYWNNNDLERISQYCLKDVHTTASVYLKLTGHNNIVLNPVFTAQ